MNKAAEGTAVARQNIIDGMQDGGATDKQVAEPTDILEGNKGTQTSTLVPDGYRTKSAAKNNIIAGMQDGGALEGWADGGASELVALANVLNALDPIERQNRINALTLGLSSAQRQTQAPASINPQLLIDEVRRAYSAILAKANPLAAIQVPTPPTPVPVIKPPQGQATPAPSKPPVATPTIPIPTYH